MTNIERDNMTTWRQVLDSKVNLALGQISHIQNELANENVDPKIVESLCEPYLEVLKEIYQDEYPLASALEESDLVVRLKGEGVDNHNPRLAVISSYFSKVRKQVTNMAKAIADIDAGARRLPKEFDLTLTAYARGSVVLGFSLPTINDLEADGQPGLYGVDDPFYKAARQAMKTLGLVSQVVSRGGSLENVAEAVPDAKIRDVALNAVKELAPSGRQGVSSVSIAGKDIGEFEEGRLTKQTKDLVRKELEHPVRSDEAITIYGHVREMDLDAKRFELRHVENMEDNSLRCKYAGLSDSEAKSWFNKFVKVSGIVERDANRKARLMEVNEIEPG